MHAVLVGYVEYPVIGLESGLAPAADLSPVLAASANLTAHSNTTNTFAACPEAGTGPTGVVYAGSLVGPPCSPEDWYPTAWFQSKMIYSEVLPH